MLKAPPLSGKTSFLKLCRSHIHHDKPEQFQDVLYFSCLYVGTDKDNFEEAFERRQR